MEEDISISSNFLYQLRNVKTAKLKLVAYLHEAQNAPHIILSHNITVV